LINRKTDKIIKLRNVLALLAVLSLAIFAGRAVISNYSAVRDNNSVESDNFDNMKVLGSTTPAPIISAKAGIVYELNSGKLLFTKNPNLKLKSASLVKIMTALIVLENENINRIITVSKKAATMEPNIMGLYPGEKLSVEQLLYGLILASGNDSAAALAESTAGSEEKFVSMMNEKAGELKLNETLFSNATGLDDGNEQYSTAFDLMSLTLYTLKKYPEFEKISSTKDYFIGESFIGEENHKAFHLKHSSPLIDYPGFSGIKPGFTPQSHLSLITLIKARNHKLLIVILGSDDRKNETISLIEYGQKVIEENGS